MRCDKAMKSSRSIPVSVDVTQRIHLDVKAGVGVRQESRY